MSNSLTDIATLLCTSGVLIPDLATSTQRWQGMLSPSSDMRERSEKSDCTLSSSFERTRTTGFESFLVDKERMILSTLHTRWGDVNGGGREGEGEEEGKGREKERGGYRRHLVLSSFIPNVVARLRREFRSALVSTR